MASNAASCVDAVLVQHAAVLAVVIAAPRELGERSATPLPRVARLDGTSMAGGDDFAADSIAWDHCDSIVL